MSSMSSTHITTGLLASTRMKTLEAALRHLERVRDPTAIACNGSDSIYRMLPIWLVWAWVCLGDDQNVVLLWIDDRFQAVVHHLQ